MKSRRAARDTARFVILVPHRDALKVLLEYRAALFAGGFHGAWSFPACAVLAEVSRPLRGEELRELARNVRNAAESDGGKIESRGASREGGGKETWRALFYGPPLTLPLDKAVFPGTVHSGLITAFLPPVLCAALAVRESPERLAPGEAPSFSFRTAAVANLAVRPLPEGEAGYSYVWRTSGLTWLPPYKAKADSAGRERPAREKNT